MFRKIAAVVLGLVAAGLVACGGSGQNGNVVPMGTTFKLPSIDKDLEVTAVLPKNTLGEEEPAEGLGTVMAPKWSASSIGGFTQIQYSQTLAFPPGTKITVRNLSKTTTHTLNVVKRIFSAPTTFPASPVLSFTPHGNGLLGVGYASGPIGAGKSITVTMPKSGNYVIGCAFHYRVGMRGILVVAVGATPGPQATPPPSPTPTDSGGGGGGGGW